MTPREAMRSLREVEMSGPDPNHRLQQPRTSTPMTITRGLSQVLFSFLPDQTADLEGGVWQVTNWADARFVAVDDDVVRREVARAAYPWTAAEPTAASPTTCSPDTTCKS